MGIQLPSPKSGRSPQFSAHVCCGQMARWIKMLLGKEVGLSPDDIVLDGDTAPLPQKGSEPRNYHICCGQTAGWMKMPLGTEVDLIPGHIALDGDPALPAKGAQQPPLFLIHVYYGLCRPSQLLLSSCIA